MRVDPLNNELVRDFIIAAHGDLREVKRLVMQEPALIHAVLNWGGNDWESGLGAAAHTGNRDIAEWLLQRGARMDIFTAAMLGELQIVQAMVECQPNAIHATGPHGISLIRHAEKGGEAAAFVYAYLASLTAKEEVV